MATLDFHCHKCGKEVPTAPPLPTLPICKECCEDHDYRYERGSQRHECIHCGKEAPLDWFSP